MFFKIKEVLYVQTSQEIKTHHYRPLSQKESSRKISKNLVKVHKKIQRNSKNLQLSHSGTKSSNIKRHPEHIKAQSKPIKVNIFSHSLQTEINAKIFQ